MGCLRMFLPSVACCVRPSLIPVRALIENKPFNTFFILTLKRDW